MSMAGGFILLTADTTQPQDLTSILTREFYIKSYESPKAGIFLQKLCLKKESVHALLDLCYKMLKEENEEPLMSL